ncbi:hypothetical protein ZWY2020_055939 [Hordeum vulgare]|nr:hypothetical protein ZWY2020_055939 [Hordeum vulgare]
MARRLPAALAGLDLEVSASAPPPPLAAPSLARHQVVAQHPTDDSGEDSDSDFVYIPHSDDSGEDSEVVDLRRHARKFKKRMRDNKSWIGRDASGPVPIDLIANLEQQIAGE